MCLHNSNCKSHITNEEGPCTMPSCMPMNLNRARLLVQQQQQHTEELCFEMDEDMMDYDCDYMYPSNEAPAPPVPLALAPAMSFMNDDASFRDWNSALLLQQQQQQTCLRLQQPQQTLCQQQQQQPHLEYQRLSSFPYHDQTQDDPLALARSQQEQLKQEQLQQDQQIHHYSYRKNAVDQSTFDQSTIAGIRKVPVRVLLRRDSLTSTDTAKTSCSTTTTALSSSVDSSSISYEEFTAKRRRVRFQDQPQIHEYERPYTKQDKPMLWYSKPAIREAHRQERDMALLYATEICPAYLTQLLQIWTTPCTQTEVLQRLVQPICMDNPIRGLEKHCLQQMKQRRGIVLKRVLQAQHELRQVCDKDDRAWLLQQECEPLSRTSVRFARAMAQGDAMAAAAMDSY